MSNFYVFDKPYLNTLGDERIRVYEIFVNKVELWDKFDSIEKSNLFSKYINTGEEISIFTSYFDKYSYYLSKNSFNYFTKDVISLKF